MDLPGMRRGVTLGLALAGALLAGAAGAANRALIVGVGAYRHLDADAQLKQPPYDAARFRAFLIEQGWFKPDEITLLVNEEATEQGVRDAIKRRLVAETRPGDRALFYFSGHGTRFDDKNGDEPDGKDEVLVAHDAARPGGGGVLVDDGMSALLDSIADRNLMVLIDACHSGTGTRGGGGQSDPEVRKRSVMLPQVGDRGVARPGPPPPAPPAPPQAAAERPVAEGGVSRAVWAAAAPTQQAWEDAAGGVFTNLFMEGVRDRRADANRNGQLSGAELLDYVRGGSDAWCRRSKNCRDSGLGFTTHVEGPTDAILAAFTRDGAPAQPPAAQPPAAQPPAAQPAANQPAANQPPASQPPANQLPAAQPPAAGFAPSDLLGLGNGAGLKVAIDRGQTLRLGEEIRLLAQAGADGALVIFDVNPRGEIHQLSPSRLSRPDGGRVRAGEVVEAPQRIGAEGGWVRLRVSEPVGRGQLVALLVEDASVEIDRLLGANLALQPVPDAAGYLTRLGEALRRMHVDGDANRAVRWSVAYFDYEITR